MSLHDNVDEISSKLPTEVAARVAAAGVSVIKQIEGRGIVMLGHLERNNLVANLMIVLCGDQGAQSTTGTTRNQESGN